MRDLFGDSIAGFGEILSRAQNDVLEIRDFSGHRSKYTEKCPVASQIVHRLYGLSEEEVAVVEEA
jgi:hypothetical protein